MNSSWTRWTQGVITAQMGTATQETSNIVRKSLVGMQKP